MSSSKIRNAAVTRENTYYESLDSLVSIFGVTHSVDSVEEIVFDDLCDYRFDSILYEDHVYDGFCPEEVPEHRAIYRYSQHYDNVRIRSMDISGNSDQIDSLMDIMSEITDDIPGIEADKLTSEKGMIKFNADYEAEFPDMYSCAHILRNDIMSMEIIEEAKKVDVGHMAVLVGKSHIFGSDSIQKKLEKNISNYKFLGQT